MYDYLIVGSGLFGAVFAHEAKQAGKSVLVLERRDHIGGNVYCEEKDGINIHKYGAHIFHTSYEDVWAYVNRFVTFNNFINSPVANYQGHLYNLPFNMNTFRELWDIVTPAQAKAIIAEQRKAIKGEPQNLEEQAISLVGTDIYTKLIKGYTEKQWGRSCTELPAFIIKRLPVRYTFDNNYFNDRYQGIPVGGYNKLIEALLDGIEVRTGVDYLKERAAYQDVAKKVVYTGSIDEYFDYKLGQLEYRGLHFETERLEEENHQGVAVVNYTEREIPYTSTSTSSSARSPSPTSHASTQLTGIVARRRITRSITSATRSSTSSTQPWPSRKRTPSSAAVWQSISTTIWMTSLRARWSG